MNKNEITPVQIAIRIVIIIIVITVLLLVSFAMVRVVPKIISTLGDARGFFAPKERMEASLSSEIIDQNENTVLTYRQIGGKAVGYYSFSYSCAHIDSATRIEIENEALLCDKPLIINSAASSTTSHEITLRAAGKDIPFDQDLSIIVSHMNASTTLSKASVTLSVRGKENIDEDINIATSTVSIPKPTPVKTVPSQPSYYSTIPTDLSVSIGQVSVDQNARAYITFYVTNRGGQNSGSWKFRADLPREIGQTVYNSPFQPSIPPQGTSIMYLNFGNAAAGNINIYVDDINIVRESNESNNSASVTLK